MSADFFMSEKAYREMQEDQMPTARGWASQFSTYEDACHFYGLPTPAQERAETDAMIEQWFNALPADEQRAYIQEELYRLAYEVPAYCDRYQPEQERAICLDPTDPFSSTVMMPPISVALASGQIVRKQLYMNDLTSDGREVGYINVWIHRVPVVRVGLTKYWKIDVEAARALMQA